MAEKSEPTFRERPERQLATFQSARRLVREYLKTGDVQQFLAEIIYHGYHFGKSNRYCRELFTQFLIQEFSGKVIKHDGLAIKSKHYQNNTKCNHCRWEVTVLYSFPNNNIDREGLCGSCFMDMIVQEQMRVSPDPALHKEVKT